MNLKIVDVVFSGKGLIMDTRMRAYRLPEAERFESPESLFRLQVT